MPSPLDEGDFSSPYFSEKIENLHHLLTIALAFCVTEEGSSPKNKATFSRLASEKLAFDQSKHSNMRIMPQPSRAVQISRALSKIQQKYQFSVIAKARLSLFNVPSRNIAY